MMSIFFRILLLPAFMLVVVMESVSGFLSNKLDDIRLKCLRARIMIHDFADKKFPINIGK